MLKNALVALPTLHAFTAGLSAAAIATLLMLKNLPLHKWLKLAPAVPKSIFGDLGPFTTMVLFTLLNSVFGFSALQGIAEVGVVPSGLPNLSSPLGISLAGRYKDVAVLTFVMLVETVAIGKALAAKAGQSIDNAQEFIALGLSNVAGSFFQAYTCAGSFSRSAVVVSTGGKSQLGGIVTAISLVLTLIFLTPLFTHVPKSTLAACLIVAVSNLVDTNRIAELWTQSKGMLAFYAVYVGLMLAFGAAEGLMASVALFYAVGALKKLGSKLSL
jgi:SulP family sulfate permease